MLKGCQANIVLPYIYFCIIIIVIILYYHYDYSIILLPLIQLLVFNLNI